MNKVFKVIWSEARNAYVVVSEMAKSHGTKSCSTKKLLAMLIATGVMTCASMAPAMASNPASDDLNVTIGKGAHVSVWNGVTGKNITGDIAVGPNAHAWNGEYSYGSEGRIGSKEYLLDFGQGGVVGAESFFGIPYKYKVADGSKIAGSIAIGKNTVARTGSVMLGDHSYTGNLGDIEINPANAMTYNDGIYSTTLGAGAYNSGSLAAVTGALSIASGKDTKNTGATIYGSMNSIESATSDNIYSGVASSVLGFANRTQNANAALIWGTGNEVTNSVEDIGIDTKWNKLSVAEAQQKAIEAMQSSKYAGGSVMAIGGGNKADYAKYSQLTGVQNKVTGTEAKAAKYDFVNGYKNTVTEASDVTVIGSKNEVTADGNKVIGDNHRVSGKDNVIFGSADQLTETTVNNAVVLGHNAKVTGEGGVALGAGSVANRANAVSVGSKGAERQIINVAAGTEDTDAVNLSQLNAVKETANKGWNLSTNGGEASKVAPDATVDFSGDKNISVSHDGTKVQVELNKNIDVNYVQTNALNAKYNLSVGTANENGTVPFLVNSTGAFYAANNNFSVDKYGKVIATAGEIGNVVLQNGVYTGNSALRDGELYVGDASGNYSQITTTGAKLGQVTIAADGKISGVAAGEVSKTSTDAINGGQLHQAKADINNRIDGVENQVVNNTNRINQLGNRVNKVGAGAAALAALHPMDFDPDDKLTFSAGYGNYGGENAAAIGAYYRPDEKVMFSVAGTVGNGENMVNAGVSFALDRTNHVSNSRTALAREVIDLRGQLAVMGAKMAKMEKAFGMLDETKTKLFPDVPANHWAYEYIAKLAGNGYIEGYPDGNFGGDRLMTRYEFAAMLYRAIEKGAALEEKIIKEFEPELGRIRVDRISGEDGDRDKIERVRVNDTKGERDHYGNKLAK